MTNATKALPEFYVDVLGKRRLFKYGLRGATAIEQKLGVSMLELGKLPKMGITELSILMWAGLLKDDKTLDYDQFLDALDLDELLEKFAPIITDALKRSLPDLEEAEIKKEVTTEQPQ